MKASNILYTILAAALLVSCSMTKGIPEDDQLFTGLTKIAYASEPKLQDETYSKHLATTKEELEAALATQPNGSLFGSSYYTVPWSWHLWVYNKCNFFFFKAFINHRSNTLQIFFIVKLT